MNPAAGQPIARLCYAGICAALGGLLVALGTVGDAGVLAPIGGIVLVIGLIYLVTGLWGLATVLTDPTEPD